MAEIGNLIAVISSDVTGLVDGFAKAGASTKKLRDQVLESSKVVAAFGVASAAAAAGGLAALYTRSADLVDQQAKLARAVGATTGGFQSLAYAADLAGVNQEALAAASGKLNNKLGDAITQGGASAAVFERLGLNVQALADMDADQRFAAIADRIKSLGIDSTVTGDALKEMGLKGEEMRQFLMDGGDQIRAASEELAAFGVRLNDVDSNKIEAANDAMSRIGLIAQGAGNQFAVAFSPYVEAASKKLGDLAKESGGFKPQIESAMSGAINIVGGLADAIHLAGLAWDGAKVGVAAFGALAATTIEAVVRAVFAMGDAWTDALNGVVKLSNDVLKTNYELYKMPSDSAFFQGVTLAAEVARDNVVTLKDELLKTSAAEYPSEKIKAFLNDVAAEAKKAGQETKNSRDGATLLPAETETQKTSKKKSADKSAQQYEKNQELITGLSAETAAMQAELQTRAQLAQIYRQAELGADASFFAQKMADIAAAEQAKIINEEAAYQAELARMAERRTADLERAAGDREAMAAIHAQYDQQEILAEQLKQQGITDAQAEAQASRAALREQERQNAISVALGLGGQLMALAQGQSKTAFEASKKLALASAVIDGWRSATSAWAAGMSTGGPWAPAVAAAYTAASLARTGAMINSIRSANYGSSGGGAGSAGASSAPAVGAAAGGGGGGGAAPAGANAGQTMTVRGMNPNDLFTGAAVQQIAKGLLDFQRDGGKVILG